MKINSVYIESFGKLKQKKIDFSDGLNVIYGENENGKTTVMSFIKMMFYGSERGSQALSKNTRKKYTPWDGSQMAGSIDFEHNGKKYRLEREFRASNSTDKVTLIDVRLGTRKAVSGDIGEKFFSLSLAAFERSVFIGQLNLSDNDAAAQGEINAKLSNITSTGDQDVSFEEVNSRLEKAKLSLKSKSGRAGELDKNLKLLSELQSEYDNSVAITHELSNKKSRITEIEAEINSLKTRSEQLKAKISAENDIRNAEKLRLYLEKKSELDKENEKLKLSNGASVDEIYFGKLKFLISKLNGAKEKENAKLAEIKTLEKSVEAGLNPPSDANADTVKLLEENVTKLQNELNGNKKELLQNEIEKLENQKSINSAPKTVAILCFAVFALAAVVTAVAGLLIPAVACGVLAVLSVVLFFVFLSNAKAKENEKSEQILRLKNEIADYDGENAKKQQELFSLKARLDGIKTILNTTSAMIENQQKMLSECRADYDLLKAQTEEQLLEVKNAIKDFCETDSEEEIFSAVDKIAVQMQKVKELKNELNYLARDLDGISYREAEIKLEKLNCADNSSATDFEALKEEYESINTKTVSLKSEEATLLAEAKSALANLKPTESLKQQISQLKEKIKEQEHFCNLCDLAIKTLAESFAQIRESYGSKLESDAAEIFKGLTNGKYDRMTVSKSFEIGVNETNAFGNREIGYLSSGTVDQAYLSLRLALSKLICESNEQLPVLLDDALTQYDDNRVDKAVEFLNGFANERQVIMFTCHKRVKEKAEQIMAKCQDF